MEQRLRRTKTQSNNNYRESSRTLLSDVKKKENTRTEKPYESNRNPTINRRVKEKRIILKRTLNWNYDDTKTKTHFRQRDMKLFYSTLRCLEKIKVSRGRRQRKHITSFYTTKRKTLKDRGKGRGKSRSQR